MALDGSAEDMQVLVSFVTKLSEELRVPEAAMAVPVSLKRLGLSQIINGLLGLDPARPFDFIINDQLLRKSLHQHVLDNELSAESTLVVEYVPAVVPPKQQRSMPHDDWVSAVGACPSRASMLASGSYDGALRLWRTAAGPGGELSVVATVPGAHGPGVTALAWLPSTQGSGRLLLTAGKDHAVRLWQVDEERGGATVRAVAEYAGHGDCVEGVAVSPGGDNFASCGWDGGLLLWRTGDAVVADAAEAGGEPAKKLRKGGGAKGAASTATPTASAAPLTEGPSGRLEGHLHCVSCATWPSTGVLFSGGWDHSVRRWDVPTGVCTDTYNGSKALHACAASSASPDVVAFGGADRALRLWDCRSRKGDALAVSAYTSHAGWISGIAWSSANAHHLASCGHDGAVKLWDARGAVPLATLAAHSDKALCVAWMGGGGVASGGTDCKLSVFSHEATAAAATAS
ncbi:hypothetical protein FOA52_013860 [Chlamydomonas sp. UWO 241]|nr:hypothetical protein FOA52_013860 [Chlamydomonas sp. UWO 241]